MYRNRKNNKPHTAHAVAICVIMVMSLVIFTGCKVSVAAPENLTAEAAGLHEITATWDASENATAYDVVLTVKAQADAQADGDASANTENTEETDGDAAADIPATPETGATDNPDNAATDNPDNATTESSGEGTDSSVSDSAAPDTAASGSSAPDTTDTSADVATDSADETADDATPAEITKTTTGTSITFDGLTADTEYEISVLAVQVKGDKRTEAETPVSATVKTDAPEVGKVTEVTATATSDTEISVNWAAYEVGDITNADGTPATVLYTLYVSESEGGEFAPAAENTGEVTFAHAGLTEKTARWYKVVPTLTVDGKAFVGAESDVATAVTNDAPVAEPEPAGSASGSSKSGSSKSSGSKSSGSKASTGGSSGGSSGGNSSTPVNKGTGEGFEYHTIQTRIGPVRLYPGEIMCKCGTKFPTVEAVQAHMRSFMGSGDIPDGISRDEFNVLLAAREAERQFHTNYYGVN
jgi:uncharacterized membrane protein YgcG